MCNKSNHIQRINDI
jgi:hypothetical protein